MKAIIYGKPGCNFCEQAKILCNEQSVDFDYKIVGVDITKEDLQEQVGRPIRTVPQIFLMDQGFAEYVGGFNELRDRLK